MKKTLSISIVTAKACLVLLLSLAILLLYAAHAASLSDLGLNAILTLVVAIVVLLAICKYQLLSFVFLFAMLTWVFHFGLFPLFFFSSEKLILANDLRYYSMEEIVNGYKICLLFYDCLLLGMCMKKTMPLPSVDGTFQFGKRSVKSFTVLFIILFGVYIIDVFKNLSLSGYLAVRARGMSSLVAYSNELLYLLAIILFYKANQHNAKLERALIVLCFVPTIFAGERGTAVCLITVLLMIALRSKKIHFRVVVRYFLLAVLALYVLNSIGRYRTDFSYMLSQLFSAENFSAFVKDNPLLHFLGEFGGTFTTPMVTVKNFPSVEGFFFGGTYISSLTLIIPGLSRIVPVKYLVYAYAIPAYDNHHLGGSFIGEAYANFGVFGFPLIMLWGNFVKALDQKTEKQENELYVCWLFMLEFVMLMVIRGYIKNIVFWAFWGWIIIHYCFNKTGRKRVRTYAGRRGADISEQNQI